MRSLSAQLKSKTMHIYGSKIRTHHKALKKSKSSTAHHGRTINKTKIHKVAKKHAKKLKKSGVSATFEQALHVAGLP